MSDAVDERTGEMGGGAVIGKTYEPAPRKDDTDNEAPAFTLSNICRAMELDSDIGPVAFYNSFLVPIRISGTMAAARPSLGEIAFRDPSVWSQMIPSAMGCPVLVEHPASGALDSQEFAKRAVGSIVHAWIQDGDEGPELWGVARILDSNCAAAIAEGLLFDTSPSVIFPEGMEGEYLETDDGSRILIEAIPAFIDHVALLASSPGVWTRDSAEPGIRTTENSTEGGSQ